MATIKLGDKTLGNIAVGSSTIGDVRKLATNKIFRVHALSNHDVGKTISSSIGSNSGGGDLPGGSGGDSTWLLSTGYWDDNGVWDDTQTWSD
jgi:hypothetical protein